MARCPNCDRETVRTKDWVCLHCGYPLLSGSYKIIDNTFRELKDMVESGQITKEDIIRRPVKKVKTEAPLKQHQQQPAERKPETVAEQAAPEPPKQSRPSFFGRPKQQQPTERKPEPSPETEPAPATKPAATRPAPTPPLMPTTRTAQAGTQAKPSPSAKTPPPAQAQSTPTPQPTLKAAPAPASTPLSTSSPSPFSRPQPAPAPKQEPNPEARPAAIQPPSVTLEPGQDAKPVQAQQQGVKPEPPPEVKPAPVTAQPLLEITVEELISTYETEGPGAEANFAGKILKLTGSIDRINVRDALNIYQIVLNSPKKNVLLQGVRCVFDKSRAAELTRLSAGQKVTVQGKYDGSIIDISLRDCFLVN